MLNNRALKIIVMSTAFLLVIVCLSFARTDHKEYRGAKLEDCRDCHSGSGVMDNHGAFFMNEHKLLAQKASSNCADCHQQSFCLDCHKGGGLEPDLQKSLSRRGEYMPKTHRSDFISIHPVKAADNPRDCYRCHESSFCSDCHNRQIQRNRSRMSIKRFDARPITSGIRFTRRIRMLGFGSLPPGEAKRNLQSCQACHPQKADCTNFLCHPNLGGR